MPDRKMFYSIGEVSEILGESTTLVRYWSDRFSDFIKPVRNKKGNRMFTVSDLSSFKLIHYLVKERGMTLEGAAMSLKGNRAGLDRRLAAIETLKGVRMKLKEVLEII